MKKSKQQRREEFFQKITPLWDNLMLTLLNEGYSVDQAGTFVRLLTKAQYVHKGKAPKKLVHAILSSEILGPPGPKPRTPFTTPPLHIRPLPPYDPQS